MPPIRLAFKVRAVTRGALPGIDCLPTRDKSGVVWVGPCRLVARDQVRARSSDEPYDGDDPADQPSVKAPHLDLSDRRHLKRCCCEDEPTGNPKHSNTIH